MAALGAAVIAYSPYVVLLAVWLACCAVVRSGTRRLMCFCALLALSLGYFWYTMPRNADGALAGAASSAAASAGDRAVASAAAVYRKYVDDMAGTRRENRGNVEALMAKQQRIEKALYDDNRGANPQFARHVDQLQAMGMPSHTVQTMSTSIHGDLQESIMADRNVGAIKPATMTHPSVVGQFADAENMGVPQQRGDSLSRATGLTDQLMPGPKATTTSDGLPAIKKEQTQVISDAVSTGIMAGDAKGEASGLEAVFSANAAAAGDTEAGELLAAAVSAADRN